MPDEKKFKKKIRARMERTGESYSAARHALDNNLDETPAAEIPSSADALLGANPITSWDEGQLVAELRAAVASIRTQIRAFDTPERAAIDALGEMGHALHTLLAARGHAPRHRKIFVENRRAPEGSVEFYAHFHSAESLLRFIDDPHANDDPEDVTIDHEFAFEVYMRRWSSRETIHVKRTRTGWSFRYVSGPVDTGPDAHVKGKPKTGLFGLLNAELVNYPAELPEYFKWLWERAAEDGLDHDAVQKALADVATWVSECERRSPRGIFEGLS